MAIRIDAATDAYTVAPGITTVGTIICHTLLVVDRNAFSDVWNLKASGSYRALHGTNNDGTTLMVGDGGALIIGSIAASLSTWYSYAATMNGTAYTVYSAQFGQALTSQSGSAATGLSGLTAMEIGGSGTSFLNGRICNLKVYNVVLTQTEIETELARWSPARTSGLVKWLPLSCADVLDHSGVGAALTAGSTAPTFEANPPIASYGASALAPFVADRSQGTTASGTTHSIANLPAGAAAGDTLIAVVSSDGIPTLSTASAGWGPLGAQINEATSQCCQAVFIKTATGSDALSVTSSATEETSYVVLAVRGGGTPVIAAGAQGNSTNSNPPALTPAGGSKAYLWVATRGGDAQVVATAAPTNYANLTSQAGGTATGASTNTAERVLAGTTDDPGTFTSVTEQWVAYTLAVPPAYPKITTLTDDFATQDAAKWQFGTGVTATGGRLQLATVNTSYFGAFSINDYDLTNSSATIELVQALNVGNGTTGIVVACSADGANRVSFLAGEGGNLTARKKIANTETVQNTATYSSTNHRWLRISESGGTITWWTSADGIAWNSFATWALAGFVVTSVGVDIQAGYFGTEPSPGTALLDNFNNVPAAAAPEGQWFFAA